MQRQKVTETDENGACSLFPYTASLNRTAQGSVANIVLYPKIAIIPREFLTSYLDYAINLMSCANPNYFNTFRSMK